MKFRGAAASQTQTEDRPKAAFLRCSSSSRSLVAARGQRPSKALRSLIGFGVGTLCFEPQTKRRPAKAVRSGLVVHLQEQLFDLGDPKPRPARINTKRPPQAVSLCCADDRCGQVIRQRQLLHSLEAII
jgi:hypothetical protein